VTIRLIIFDVDGTLVEAHTANLLPGVREFFQLVCGNRCQPAHRPALAIATNQGGVGMRYWMEQQRFGHPERYPSEPEITQRMAGLVAELDGATAIPIYMAFRFKDWRGKWSPVPPEAAGDPRWSPDWRKPGPGMLRKAMEDAGVTAGQSLFVGDRPEDQKAARAAGCAFGWAKDFFASDWKDCDTLMKIVE
jgi:HAD superfamily hydrolase (TIGR01662 family)